MSTVVLQSPGLYNKQTKNKNKQVHKQYTKNNNIEHHEYIKNWFISLEG